MPWRLHVRSRVRFVVLIGTGPAGKLTKTVRRAEAITALAVAEPLVGAQAPLTSG